MTKKVEIRFLSQEQVASLKIGWEEIIDKVRLANSEHVLGHSEMPPKRGVHSRPFSFINEMPVYMKNLDLCGLKWTAQYPANAEKDLNAGLGLMILNDADTGAPLMIMDDNWLTSTRTAAVSVLNARYLSKKNPRTFALIGAGLVGKMHAFAFRHMIPSLETLYVYDVYPPAVDKLKQYIPTRAPGLEVVACNSIEEAVGYTPDIVITCTQRAEKPIMPSGCLKPGMLAICVACPTEWPREYFFGAADKLVTDDYPQMAAHAHEWFDGANPDWYCRIGDLVNGTPGRESDREIILVNCMGLAVNDVTISRLIYERAVEANIGQIVTMCEGALL